MIVRLQGCSDDLKARVRFLRWQLSAQSWGGRRSPAIYFGCVIAMAIAQSPPPLSDKLAISMARVG